MGNTVFSPVPNYYEHLPYGPFPKAKALKCQICVLSDSAEINRIMSRCGFALTGDGIYERHF